MKIVCLELLPDGRLVPCESRDAIRRWRASDGAFWIDATGYDPQSLEALLDEIEVEEFPKRRCLEAGSGSTVIALASGTFAEWPVYADRANSRREQAVTLCLENLLLTMHAGEIEAADDIREAVGMLALESRTISAVLASLAFYQTVVTGRQGRTLRDRVLALGRSMDEDPDGFDPPTLDSIKRGLLLCDAIAEEQMEAFELLSQAGSVGFDAEAVAGPMALVRTRARATARLVDRVDHRAETLVRRYQDVRQDLLNRRLGFLTMISAIFLPLTLLAGIWGMNFENMPELDDPNAYPIALGTMAFVALLGFAFFYKRGWFD